MKKKYMMAACACMSCVLLGSGTYVYARPETSVTNHFSTGVVDINLDEYELTANGGEEPFRDYTGKKGENPLIMPGDDISKIPRITNDGNDCYVRAKLEFSGTDVDLEKELYGFPSGWEKHDDGYYYYKNILNTGDTYKSKMKRRQKHEKKICTSHDHSSSSDHNRTNNTGIRIRGD